MWHQKPKGSFEKKEVANPVCFLRKAGKIRGESNAISGVCKKRASENPWMSRNFFGRESEERGNSGGEGNGVNQLSHVTKEEAEMNGRTRSELCFIEIGMKFI